MTPRGRESAATDPTSPARAPRQDTPSRPVLSLFSGAGGLDLGFERAGFQPLLALDSQPVAVETGKQADGNADRDAGDVPRNALRPATHAER